MIEVDEDFAWDAAEGDRTRQWWLDAHRHCGKLAARKIRAKRRDPHRSTGRLVVDLLKHQLINRSALCASSGFISRICSSL